MIPREDRAAGREVFADGNMADVYREGNSVFRSTSPWADAAHQVLVHFEKQGFPYSPRSRAVQGGQEELSFVPGVSIPADLSGFEDDDILVQLGRMIRQLHDALSGFRFVSGTRFVPMVHTPTSPSMICHSDIGPWNTIVSDGTISGLIDWDLVTPGTPEWDLAYAAWRFAPLYPNSMVAPSPAQRARRIALLLDAYGQPASRRKGFIDVIRQRMESAVQTVEVLERQRVPGFSALFDNGLHLGGIEDRMWLMDNGSEMRAIVE